MLIVRIIEIQHQDFTLRPGALNADTEASTITQKMTTDDNMVVCNIQLYYGDAVAMG